MKAKPMVLRDGSYIPCEPNEATHVELNMPGPMGTRIIPVQIKGTRAGTGNWSWNGDTEKPTLKPSILTMATYGPENKKMVCHSWVNDGKVQFLSDCTHSLAGQTVDLLEVD